MQPDSLPLVPIYSEYFTHKAIDSDRQCTEFCIKNGLNAIAYNVFLTVEHLPEDMRDQPLRDVILMDQVFNSYCKISIKCILLNFNVLCVELVYKNYRHQRSYSLVLKPAKCLIQGVEVNLNMRSRHGKCLYY